MIQNFALIDPLQIPSRTSQTPLLEVQNLEKHYGKIHAVNGLSLEVSKNQIYGFLGPNGSGKTTTIRMILGLVRPSSGSIQLFGKSLEKQRSSVLARVGALVETPSAYSHLSAWENLELTRRMLDSPKSRIPEVLEQVGLTDAAHRPVRGYSLGMKGRLGVATALLNSPELLILDEPTNGLDPAGIREMRDFVRSLPALGVTVLVSSHLLSEIEHMATTVGIISKGQMRFQGPLEVLRARFQPYLKIKVSDPERARELLEPNFPILRLEGNLLEVSAPEESTTHINRQLEGAGIGVSHLELTRPSLEDIFLELTGENTP